MLPRQSQRLDTDDTDETDRNGQKIRGRSPCLSVSYTLVGLRRRFAGQFRRKKRDSLRRRSGSLRSLRSLRSSA